LSGLAVRDTNVQLAPIVEHCGRNALSVDFAASCIKEYGGGDPAKLLNVGTSDRGLSGRYLVTGA